MTKDIWWDFRDKSFSVIIPRSADERGYTSSSSSRLMSSNVKVRREAAFVRPLLVDALSNEIWRDPGENSFSAITPSSADETEQTHQTLLMYALSIEF